MSTDGESWPGGTDWGKPGAVAIVLNNLLCAWSGYAELAEQDSDGPEAESDQAQAAHARTAFLLAVEQAVGAGSLPPVFGAHLAGAESAAQGAAWLLPYVTACQRRRALVRECGESAALRSVRRHHARVLLLAVTGGFPRPDLLSFIAAAWADGLLTARDAEDLAGDRHAAIAAATWLAPG